MHTGKTSMHISVSVYARDPKTDDARFTTHCILVFVAMDAEGNPRPVPTYTPADAHAKRLNTYARKMIELRQNMQDEARVFLDDLEVGDHAG